MLSYCVTVFKTRHFEQENRLSKWLWLENQFFLCFNHLWHPFCMYLNMLWQFITSRGQNVAATFMHSVSQRPRAKLPQAPTPCVEAPWLSSILENCQNSALLFCVSLPQKYRAFSLQSHMEEDSRRATGSHVKQMLLQGLYKKAVS